MNRLSFSQGAARSARRIPDLDCRPLVSFGLADLCLGGVGLLEPHRAMEGFLVLGSLLGAINFQLGLFNLIPGFPLDGGRVLRAALWASSGNFVRATQCASLAGQGFGLAFGLLGVGLLFAVATGRLPGPMAANAGWIVLIGGFLYGTAKSGSTATRLAAVTEGHWSLGNSYRNKHRTSPDAMTDDE